MSCPTCGHTMQNMGGAFFWCPRCGTVKERWSGTEPPNVVSTPMLVDRVRDFGSVLNLIKSPGAPDAMNFLLEHWHTTGIEESIGPPKG